MSRIFVTGSAQGIDAEAVRAAHPDSLVPRSLAI